MSNKFQAYPLKFHPIPQKRIWGGNRLVSYLNKPFNNDLIGESWEISTIENNVSIIANGVYQSNNFLDLIKQFPQEILGKEVYEKYGSNFPLLIKFIDANNDLSIQLHPNDDLAMQRHKSLGKEEMWYIMEAQPQSRLMFGFNHKIDKEVYFKHLKNNTLESILHYENVSIGDVYHIPTGRVHAIGKGILLAEIQQSSDVTYRLYDYNRLDENGNLRKLHTDLALDAIDFNIPTQFKTTYQIKENEINNIVKSNYFTTNIMYLNQKIDFDSIVDKDSFTIYICVEGKGKIINDNFEVAIKEGESVLIPASMKQYYIIPETSLKLLQVFS